MLSSIWNFNHSQITSYFRFNLRIMLHFSFFCCHVVFAATTKKNDLCLQHSVHERGPSNEWVSFDEAHVKRSRAAVNYASFQIHTYILPNVQIYGSKSALFLSIIFAKKPITWKINLFIDTYTYIFVYSIYLAHIHINSTVYLAPYWSLFSYKYKLIKF
jgi:hypothetical protein